MIKTRKVVSLIYKAAWVSAKKKRRNLVKIVHFLKADCYLLHISMSHWANLNSSQFFFYSFHCWLCNHYNHTGPVNDKYELHFLEWAKKRKKGQKITFNCKTAQPTTFKHSSFMCGRCTPSVFVWILLIMGCIWTCSQLTHAVQISVMGQSQRDSVWRSWAAIYTRHSTMWREEVLPSFSQIIVWSSDHRCVQTIVHVYY